MTEQLVLLTTSEVAKALNVDSSTVRRWVAQGKLTPALVTPGGQYRFRKADLQIPASSPEQAREHKGMR